LRTSDIPSVENFLEPPTFLQKLENTVAPLNKQIRLNARVSSVPDPEIKWFKHWYPLAESSRIKFVFEPPCMYSLVINDPILRDSGVYTCTAINEGGKTNSSATLTVEGTRN